MVCLRKIEKLFKKRRWLNLDECGVSGVCYIKGSSVYSYMHKNSYNLLQVRTAHEAKNINKTACKNNSCTAVSTAITVVEVH